jgi:hypothetical protein
MKQEYEEIMIKKDKEIARLINELEKMETKYFCATAKAERLEFGRQYEEKEYEEKEFNNKSNVKVQHKANGIIFKVPVAEELNKPIDLVKEEIEDDKEHYIREMESFYSKWYMAEPDKLNIVNLEIGEIVVGYEIEVDKKGNEKKKPIKKDAWIATFFYKTKEEPTEIEEVPLIKRRTSTQEVKLDIRINYNGNSDSEAWNIAESMKQTYENMYMTYFEYEGSKFKLDSVSYNQRQKSWIATYELDSYKFKK